MNADVSQGGLSQRSPQLAAFLSFLWPGLGQWYVGRRRSAAMFAIPVALAFGAIAIQASHGIPQFALELFTPSLALTALVLVVLLGAWRLISIVDATSAIGERRASGSADRPAGGVADRDHGRCPRLPRLQRVDVLPGGHRMFVGVPDPDIGGVAAPGSSSRPGPILAALPYATPTTPDSRINVLLTGIDSTASRRQRLNDTLIVVSIDPLTRQVAMLSFPRDLSQLPLWDGRTYSDKINSLMTYAQNHPAEFPDGGLPTLMKEIGFLLGVPIHYYAALDLGGFVRMVDLVGGVDIDNQRAIDDPGYGGWTNGHPIGFHLAAGRHHLDGQSALAYARSEGAGDNDFTRSRRQQQLLVALGKKLADPAMLPQLAVRPRAGRRRHDPHELPARPAGRPARPRVVGG